jgi:hypothetical protein
MAHDANQIPGGRWVAQFYPSSALFQVSLANRHAEPHEYQLKIASQTRSKDTLNTSVGANAKRYNDGRTRSDGTLKS